MIIIRTPLRVSFFGGGTDHPDWFNRPEGGAVLSTSINKYVYIQLRRLPAVFDFKYRVVWRKVEQVGAISEIEHPVVRAVLEHYGAPDDPGFEIIYNADLPARSGLGSSSAFTVGMLHAFMAERGVYMAPRSLASEAIRVEQELLNEPVGCQDQVAVALGGLNRIDFHGANQFTVSPVTASLARREALESRLMMFFTGFTRSAGAIEAAKKQSFEDKQAQLRRMYEMVAEGESILSNERTELDEFGALLHEGWLHKRGLASAVSNPEIDDYYTAAREAGALGGKLLGAGGGGFLLFYVPDGARQRVLTALDHLVHVPFGFGREGTRAVVFDPELSSNYETLVATRLRPAV